MFEIAFMILITLVVVGFALMGIGMSLSIDGLVNFGFGIVMGTCALAAILALIAGWFSVLRY